MIKSTQESGFCDVFTMQQTLERIKEEDLPISAYALRRWIRTGILPVQKINRKIIIYWPNLMNFLACAEGVGTARNEEPIERGVIRRVKGKEN